MRGSHQVSDTPAVRLQESAPEAETRPGILERLFRLRTFDALHSGSFRWFFASMLAQFSSMHMQMVVNPWLVFELTGSYALLGSIALASAVPGLILGFVGGVVADRAPKKIVIQIGQTISAVSTLAVALLLWVDMLTFTHLLALAAIQGAVFAIIGPARQAFIPEIVGPTRLTNAIALNMAGLNVTRMGVPALGGFLIAIMGAAGVYAVMGALILLAMVTLTPIRKYVPGPGEEVPEAPERPAPVGGHGRMGSRGVADVIDGFRYLAADRLVLSLLLVNFFIVLMSMPYMQLMAGFVKQVLNSGPEGLGILWSITGIGSLVGSLAIASMPNRGRGKVFIWSALVLGFALAAFAASSWFWVSALIMVVVGVGQAGRMSLSNILVMHYTRPEFQGRVMSVYMMEFSLVSVGTFLVGVLAQYIGIQWAIGLTGLSLIGIAVYSLALVPKVRDLP